MTWTSPRANPATLAALLAIDWDRPCPLTEAARGYGAMVAGNAVAKVTTVARPEIAGRLFDDKGKRRKVG